MSSIKSTLHQIALDNAAQGIPVFPCHPLSKVPAMPNGQGAATTDPAEIDRMWAINPEFNVAACPADYGQCVIDLDPPNGVDTWMLMAQTYGPFPRTRAVRSPRGGLHLYFRGDLPSRVGAFGKGSCVDIRGRNPISGRATLTLLPGSRTEHGAYVLECDVPPADVSSMPWLPPLLERAVKPDTTTSVAGVDLDTPLATNRAMDVLRRLAPMQVDVGDNSDDCAFATLATMRDLGISEGHAGDLMLTHFPCTPCDPEWIAEKVRNVYHGSSTQNAAGSSAVQPASTVFAQAAAGATDDAMAKLRKKWIITVADMNAMEDPQWLLPEFLQDKTTALLYGAYGSMKTYLALDMTLCIATGQPFAGQTPVRQGLGVYAAGEGRAALAKGRRYAWQIGHGMEKGAEPNFIMTPLPRLTSPIDLEEFLMAVQAERDRRKTDIGLLVLDTMARFTVGVEQGLDASQATAWAAIATERLGCTTLCLTHPGKDLARGVIGSTYWEANADTVLMSTRAAERIPATSLRVAKHRDVPEAEDPWYFEGRMVEEVGNMHLAQIGHRRWQELQGQGAEGGANDLVNPGIISTALRAMGAIGLEKAVTTHVLARQIMKTHPDMGEDAVNKLASLLGRRWQHFQGYLPNHPDKKDLRWFFPTGAEGLAS